MVLLSTALTHLAVRWLHVLGMALALGGALLTWLLLRADARVPSATTLLVASTYERLFWGAMGLLVMTGVGNLGTLAPSVPRGAWSATLSAKLLLVVLLVVGSLVRSLLVVERRRDAATARDTAAVDDALRYSYAATVALLGSVLVFAEVLAHG